MSDSMERDKAELLTAKEREEVEEMKRELLDMKMYETWYTYKDMKDILGFINESKDMANMANDEKNAQKELMQSSNDCTPEMMPKTNLAQELEIQEHNDASQSIHSYRINHTSPIHERISTHGCSNYDLESAIADSRNSVYRGRNLDSEDMFVRLQDNSNTRDSYSHSTSRYISLKSKNSLQDSDIINSTETKMDTHSECDQKLERWQINPLDSCISENDVPLQEPNRLLVQDRMPFRLCKDAQTPEALEKLLPVLNFRLKQTAELWHSWHRTTDTKFQWGSPIQVGHAKDNSDKKPFSNIKTEQNQMERTNNYSNERPNKRKPSLILFASDTSYSSSDEDEKTVKKKKTQSHEDTSRVLRSNKVVCTAKCNEKDQNSDHNIVRRLFDDTETENFEAECKKESKQRFTPEFISLCSKKTTPLNVRKNIIKKRECIANTSSRSPLAHSSNEKQSAINLLSKDKDNILTDEEILIELKKDNTNENVKTCENIEIKPLPIKGLSGRIKNECMILEKIKLEKRKKLEIKKEEAQNKEIEERKKREEFYKKQIEERRRREKQKEENEKYKAEKSKKWNTVVDMKSQKNICAENKEKLQSLNKQNKDITSEIIEDNRMVEDDVTLVTDEMEIIENNRTNNVNCPICNKAFPSDKIEAHAAECEQYISDNEYENDLHLIESKSSPVSINSAEILECDVCSKYKTTNGIDYEEHVNSCLQRQHEEESLNEYSNNEIDNILNSPIRCYRPISEQTDSHIDYRRQFPSNSRKQIHSSRKRKR